MKRRLCSGCAAEIIFIQTPDGKYIPCDADPIAYWPGGHEKIVLKNGEVVSGEYDGIPGMEEGIGYAPHWATCPKASAFRRKS